MSLSVALNNARTSLLTTAKQIAVSGRNISGADDPSYTRKIAQTTTTADGGAQILSIARATDASLFYRVLDAKSGGGAQQAILDGLNRLQETVGDTTDATSPAARIAALAAALQAQANSPSDRSLAQATVTAAQAVVTSLSNASQTVTSVRDDADTDMATSVGHINDLLSQFSTLNAKIVRDTVAGEDVTDALDQRDAILSSLSQEIGVTTINRPDNDIAIYTDSGVPLFDKTPRTVSFTATSALPAGATGNAVYVDGVPVTGSGATMPIRSGTLAGLASLRDNVAPTYQAQLDELARGLIETFAESDQSGGGGADLAGLFTSTSAAIPTTGTEVPGLASLLRVNPAVDPSQGGSLDKLRDGGINGASYQYNASGAVSFATRLQDMVDEMSTARTFDPASGLQSGMSISDFSTASIGWLSDQRKSASDSVDYQNTLLSRTSEALSNATGVNMDDEYALQLQLEQSYAASSKLINIIKQLFDTLLQAT